MPFSIVQVQGGQLALCDEAGNVLGVFDDSGTKRLQVQAKLATGHGLATEETLAAIKGTDGIKKIVDALPAGTNNIGDVDIASALPVGTNEIGKVAQGTKAAGSGAWPTVLYDSAGNAVAVVLDGAVYRLRTETKIVRASDGAQINPATEETIASIKNTDGIKKITDQLPAGTNNIGDVDIASALPAGSNEIGKVAQGTKAAGSGAWPEVLYDASGNAVGVIDDSGTYRLQVQAKIAAGGAAQKVILYDDVGNLAMAVLPKQQVPANTRTLLSAGQSDDTFARILRTDIYGNLQTIPAESGQSAFGETRIAEPYQIANLINKYEIDPNDYGVQKVGGGDVVHLPLQSAIRLSVTGASGDKARLRTHNYYRYQAGRGMFIRLTQFQLDAGQTNQTRRWGYYDDNDGLFFAKSGTTLQVVRRSSTSGTPTDYPVNQANWNMDKLDGTGPSGVNIDITKGSIWELQFQWLGVGVVNWYLNGILFHQMRHPNTIAGPYMRTATLPLTWEIENTGASTASWMTAICGSIMIEGGADEPDYTFGVFNSTDITVSTTERPLISIRPKTLYNSIDNRMAVVPFLASIATDGKRASFRLVLDGSLTGASWTSANAQSGVEFDEAATAISGGLTLIRGLLPNAIDSKDLDLRGYFNNIARNLRVLAFGAGQNILTITGKNEGASGGNTLMRSSLTWQETR